MSGITLQDIKVWHYNLHTSIASSTYSLKSLALHYKVNQGVIETTEHYITNALKVWHYITS